MLGWYWIFRINSYVYFVQYFSQKFSIIISRSEYKIFPPVLHAWKIACKNLLVAQAEMRDSCGRDATRLCPQETVKRCSKEREKRYWSSSCASDSPGPFPSANLNTDRHAATLLSQCRNSRRSGRPGGRGANRIRVSRRTMAWQGGKRIPVGESRVELQREHQWPRFSLSLSLSLSLFRWLIYAGSPMVTKKSAEILAVSSRLACVRRSKTGRQDLFSFGR